MDETSQLTEFGKIFIYLIMGVLFVLFTFFLGWLVALKKPNPEKLSTYECGEEPTGSSWIQFNSRFYVVALVFLLFEVEMVFIFPWATIFAQETLLAADSRWGWLSLTEMFIFVGILLIGLMYIWKKGDLNWIRPEQILPQTPGRIPFSAYSSINQSIYEVKEFNMNSNTPAPAEVLPEARPSANKPAFKPKFNRTSG